jgi:RHS repeat-associated protein
VTRFHHRIEERNIFKTSTASFDALPFDYDANGNVAAISDGATGRVGRGDRTMAYDALDRLMSAASPMFGNGTTGTVAFTHDVLDNLVNLNMPATGPTHPMPARNQFYCYDTNWRLTSLRDADGCAGSALNTLTYDVQGNVASKDGLSYDFDFGNRLREVDAGATLVESYRYDAYGRRALSFAPSGNLLSFYDQAGQLMYQRDLRQGKLLNYIYLGGSLVAIADQGLWGGAVTAKRYQHTDALGTPVAVTDENRNVIERSEYEPYGLLLNRAQRDGPGFTGHVQDALTGLTYMQQRYFDPMIGRFLSVDPVTATSIGGNFNRYWYGNDNPYKFKDPDGRLVCNTLACEEKKKNWRNAISPFFSKPQPMTNKLRNKKICRATYRQNP